MRRVKMRWLPVELRPLARCALRAGWSIERTHKGEEDGQVALVPLFLRRPQQPVNLTL